MGTSGSSKLPFCSRLPLQAISVAVGSGVCELVGVLDGYLVAVGVLVAEGVFVMVGVFVTVGVLVMVGVFVDVEVFVIVGVLLGVAVLVTVGVLLGVAVYPVLVRQAASNLKVLYPSLRAYTRTATDPAGAVPVSVYCVTRGGVLSLSTS